MCHTVRFTRWEYMVHKLLVYLALCSHPCNLTSEYSISPKRNPVPTKRSPPSPPSPSLWPLSVCFLSLDLPALDDW